MQVTARFPIGFIWRYTMNKSLTIASVVICVSLHGAFAHSELNGIRSAMDSFMASGFADRPDSLLDLGFPRCDRVAYTNLALAVSNSYSFVFDNFQSCATNQTERYALMSCGWCFGPRYYWTFLDSLLDRLQEGGLSESDFLWFVNERNCNAGVPDMLQLTDDSVVSNIINRLMTVAPLSNYCERIKSGQALREYNEYMMELRTFK